MKKEKFLTVYAVLDNCSQQKLTHLQSELFKLGDFGTQTMDIPFHISLGSFPVEDEQELTKRIEEVSLDYHKFNIKLNRINHFNDAVLFVEPEITLDLKELHDLFDNNYANGFPWVPHITMFCGNQASVVKAKKVLESNFIPFEAIITSLEMGEFFPTRLIINRNLQ